MGVARSKLGRTHSQIGRVRLRRPGFGRKQSCVATHLVCSGHRPRAGRTRAKLPASNAIALNARNPKQMSPPMRGTSAHRQRAPRAPMARTQACATPGRLTTPPPARRTSPRGIRRRQQGGQLGRGGGRHRPPSWAHPSARRCGRCGGSAGDTAATGHPSTPCASTQTRSNSPQFLRRRHISHSFKRCRKRPHLESSSLPLSLRWQRFALAQIATIRARP